MKLLFGPLPPIARDLVLLAARVLVGVVVFAHARRMLEQNGFNGTVEGFTGLGIPAAGTSAALLYAVQLVGGPLIALGAITRAVGLLLLANMAGAVWFVHRGNGLYVEDGGWELAALVGVLALVLAVVGSGRLSLDGLVTRPAREATAEAVHA